MNFQDYDPEVMPDRFPIIIKWKETDAPYEIHGAEAFPDIEEWKLHGTNPSPNQIEKWAYIEEPDAPGTTGD